jgi:hypothetical protein
VPEAPKARWTAEHPTTPILRFLRVVAATMIYSPPISGHKGINYHMSASSFIRPLRMSITKLVFSPPLSLGFAGTDLMGESHEFHNTVSGNTGNARLFDAFQNKGPSDSPLNLKLQQLSATRTCSFLNLTCRKYPTLCAPLLYGGTFLAVRMNC